MNAIMPRTLQAERDGRTAEVIAAGSEGVTVAFEGETLIVRRAVSCLVEPEPGDLVLLGGPPGRAYVLAVLERPDGGALRLVAAGDLALTAGGRLALQGDEVVVKARTASVFSEMLAFSGGRILATVARAKLVANLVETMAERLMSRATRSHRFVEESDHLRARHVDYRAEKHLHMQAEAATVQGGVLVKVDAGQIHLG
jgi:hypothetical protein